MIGSTAGHFHVCREHVVIRGRLSRDAAQRLVEQGLTVRDAGVLLGVSHQRIAQLVRQWRSARMGARIDLEDKEATALR